MTRSQGLTGSPQPAGKRRAWLRRQAAVIRPGAVQDHHGFLCSRVPTESPQVRRTLIPSAASLGSGGESLSMLLGLGDTVGVAA
jgi:hypothetical protein